MGTEHIDEVIRNEWLAELLTRECDLATEFWIRNIRAKDIPAYRHITDKQLRQEFPPTVDSMIDAFQTGALEGPRRHSMIVIHRRVEQGFRLPELQVSLHALEEAVMQIVRKAGVSHEMELEALGSASNLLYMVALIAAEVYEQLREEQQRRFTAAYELGIMLSRILDTNTVLDTAVHKVAEYAHVDAAAIILAKPEGHRHEVVRAYYNLDISMVKAIPSIRKSLGCGIQNAEIPDIRSNPCIVSDIRTGKIPDKWLKLLTSHGYLSLACIPLQAKDERLGSLVILRQEAHKTSDSEMKFFACNGQPYS